MAGPRIGQVTDAQGRVLLAHAVQPVGFAQRLRGLIGRAALDEREAWWFEHCSAVHTFGMRRAIDVLHLGTQGSILRLDHALPPCRISLCRRGRHVLELRAGGAQALGLEVGQILEFRA